jgi:hypothetical protein
MDYQVIHPINYFKYHENFQYFLNTGQTVTMSRPTSRGRGPFGRSSVSDTFLAESDVAVIAPHSSGFQQPHQDTSRGSSSTTPPPPPVPQPSAPASLPTKVIGSPSPSIEGREARESRHRDRDRDRDQDRECESASDET